MDSIQKFGIPYQTSAQVRASFIDFFREKNHKFIPSSPLFLKDDPTLLFTNSGMAQFKPIFLGDKQSGLLRAVNSQKCLRVSGKHNDLEEVGLDTTHHTFFEMLGNWSFGDYFKREAIAWAWELLVDRWKLPVSRLFVTVHKDDAEAAELWQELTPIDPKRILRFEKPNFWEMGEVGPCGPSTEIFFDLGDDDSREATFNDPVQGVNGENTRYVEIWNLVFMQMQRLQDGSLIPLNEKHVDTGMGLERICSIIQGTGSNYQTDLFKGVMAKIADETGVPYTDGPEGMSHRVIADHLRTIAFAICDGVTPGSEGRGYVIRRILRRATRYGKKMGLDKPFLYSLLPELIRIMASAYPEIKEREPYISEVIHSEESRFLKTLDAGLIQFAKIATEAKKNKQSVIQGKEVFLLSDTYGFPYDLTAVLAREEGMSLDEEGFKVSLREQKERARAARKVDLGVADESSWTVLSKEKTTEFVGYQDLEVQTPILRYKEDGDDIYVILEKTPFYAESGGQVGDTGTISNADVTFVVEDTYKNMDFIIHRCSLKEGLVSPQTLKNNVTATVDFNKRLSTMRNHSATHLLHAVLGKVLGNHVTQQGSHVSSEGLRFDFVHHAAVNAEDLRRIETQVNALIQKNELVEKEIKSLDQAKEEGAVALFGEKYGNEVRTIRMGEASYELCGGTHVKATGEIGFFKVLSESSIASGVRRIEACTGEKAVEITLERDALVRELCFEMRSKPDELKNRILALIQQQKTQEKELQELQRQMLMHDLKVWLESEAVTLDGVTCLFKNLSEKVFDKERLSALMDAAEGTFSQACAIFTVEENERTGLSVVVGKPLHKYLSAGTIVKELCAQYGGRGGGKPGRAQGTVPAQTKSEDIIKATKALVQKYIEKK